MEEVVASAVGGGARRTKSIRKIKYEIPEVFIFLCFKTRVFRKGGRASPLEVSPLNLQTGSKPGATSYSFAVGGCSLGNPFGRGGEFPTLGEIPRPTYFVESAQIHSIYWRPTCFEECGAPHEADSVSEVSKIQSNFLPAV